MTSSSKLSFQIEVKRVLEILSNDIYDSPYALLRENIQNAYDAILIRKELKGQQSFNPRIDVVLDSKQVTIQDNGVGMNREVITNNFWKAGSSGKNNELAKKAGVVGTFGIGAMANFGVCTSLKVITHFLDGNQTIETFAKREALSVTEECIDIQTRQEKREPGTMVIAELDDSVNLNIQSALNYLKPYIRYLETPVYINQTNVSQAKYDEFFEVRLENLYKSESYQIGGNNFTFNLLLNYTKQNLVRIKCTDIYRGKEQIKGEILLSQGDSNIFGLRNNFGLAPVPISTFFNFGGIANISSLHPTAGREALSRESIELVKQIVTLIENQIAVSISKLEIADFNTGFHNYISSNNRFDLAENIKIEVRPDNERWELKRIGPVINGKKVYYYSGRDQQTILDFGNENTYLILLSQDNPRRRIQQEYVKRNGIEEVPDKARVGKVYDRKDLSIAEASLILHITNILNEDYLIPESKVYIAEISHQLPSLVEYKDNIVMIFLSRNSSAVKQVVQAYDTAYEVFGGFVKDLVRNHLYQKFSNYVPSSTKQGADALHKILMRNRELYKYEYSDYGEVESLISSGMDLSEVLKRAQTFTRSHTQSVRPSQVGSVENEIPSIIENRDADNVSFDVFAPLPPILRQEAYTDKKILKTGKPYQQLNNFTLFISVSDKVFRTHTDFFLEPHTTKVIWSMHRVVYIFTHASNRLSLYYDIELKERLADETTGGKAIQTTSIITKNRIFIPIPSDLLAYFDIKEGTKEFYVRYDIITDLAG